MEEVVPAVANVRIPYVCPKREASLVSLPGDVAATFLVAVGDRLLLGNLDGELYIAHADGTFTTLPSTGLFWDAYAEADGATYLAGTAGRVVRARLNDVPDLEVSSEEIVGTQDLLFIAGDPTPGGTLRSAADLTSYYVHDDDGWGTAFAIDEPRARMDRRRPYARHLRLRVLLPRPRRRQRSARRGPRQWHRWRYDRGRLGAGVRRAGGTEYGQVYRRGSPSNWRVLEDLEPALVQIRGFASFDGGFVYARPGGIVEVVDGVPCPYGTPVAPVGDLDRTEIGVLVEDAVLEGGRAELTVVGDDIAALAWTGRPPAAPSLPGFDDVAHNPSLIRCVRRRATSGSMATRILRNRLTPRE